EGVPLAIELAAARAATLGVEDLAEGLSDRLKLANRRVRTAPARHRSLEAMLDWSHALLSEDERVTLRRLSVFRWAFLIGAAMIVAGFDDVDIRDRLTGLVQKSLVTPLNGSRFRLLETTRIYAAERLADAGEQAAIARRHANFFRNLMAEATNPWAQVAD